MIPRRKFFKSLLAAGLIPGFGSDPWRDHSPGKGQAFPVDRVKPLYKNQVIGLGNAGLNILDHLLKSGIEGVDTVSCHTDLYRMAGSRARTKIPLVLQRKDGKEDEDPEFQLAPSTEKTLLNTFRGTSQMTLIVGLGGKTGTRFAPPILFWGRESGAFVRLVATMPFPWEGKTRLRRAEEGLRGLGRYVDESIIFSNDYPFQPGEEEFPDFSEVAGKTNERLANIIKESLRTNENFPG
jgi:cell division protein FtsZ